MSARAAPIIRDPALAITVAALWVLLALFVIYPLLMLGATAFLDEGRPAFGPLLGVLQKPGTPRAFLNSLLLATLVVFAFSRAYRNSSFYDAYWSVIPPLLLFYWWSQAGPVSS